MAPRITRLTCHAGELVGSYSKRHAVSLRLRRFVRQEFQVLFHSPRRGAFHRSLTVLCAIGRQRYLALDRGRPGFRRDLACPAVLEMEPQGSRSSPTGLSPALAMCSKHVQLTALFGNLLVALTRHPAVSQPPTAQRRKAWHARGLGCSRFARRYYGNRVCSSGYVRCFSSPGALCPPYRFRWESPPMTVVGLPHSEMAGSKPDSGSPARFGGSPRPSSVVGA